MMFDTDRRSILAGLSVFAGSHTAALAAAGANGALAGDLVTAPADYIGHFYPTLSAALAATKPGEPFTTVDSDVVLADGNTNLDGVLRCCVRTETSPHYRHVGEQADPLTRGGMKEYAHQHGLNVRDFGARGDGTPGDDIYFARAIAAATKQNAAIFVPAGNYRFKAPVTITTTGIKIVGVYCGPADKGGSEISCAGSDAFILGSPDEKPWTQHLYNGVQGVSFENLMIIQRTRDTALACDRGDMADGFTYGAGTKGITDWRGGDVTLQNVALSGFEYNFLGINSDVSRWGIVFSTSSHQGLYFGPRSDQVRIEYLYSYFCDHAVVCDGVDGFSIGFANIVACGGNAYDPILIKRGSGTCWFDHVWGESFGDVVGERMRSIIGIGTEQGYGGGDKPVSMVTVNNITYYGPSEGNHILGSLMAMGRGSAELGAFRAYRGSGQLNVMTYIQTPADIAYTDSAVRISSRDIGNVPFSKIYTNNGGDGSCVLEIHTNQGAEPHLMTTGTGGFHFREFGEGRDHRIKLTGDNAANTLGIARADINSDAAQQWRLYTQRSIQTAPAMPTTGAWQAGDTVLNDTPSVCGARGGHYILHGWRRITTGRQHVLNTDWVEMRTPTGT